MTCQRIEVRVRQHIPSVLLSGRQTSSYSQAMDSAIGKHLLTINSCRTSYEDDCFSVLHRDRDKFHLKVLEAIYISMNHSSLCRQLNNHILNIFGGTAGDWDDIIFFSPRPCNPNYIIYTPIFNHFPVNKLEKCRTKRPSFILLF